MKTAKEMAELTAATQKAWDEDGQIQSVLNAIERAAKECRYNVVFLALNDITIKRLKALGYDVTHIDYQYGTKMYNIDWS